MDAEEFKEVTGLDLYNHTREEWEEWYHKTLKEIAEKDTYAKEILRVSEIIIENKEYSTLTRILENYDDMIKRKTKNFYPKDNQYPYWCYCLFGGKEENGN